MTGFLLAGVGQKDAKGSNFLVVGASASPLAARCGALRLARPQLAYPPAPWPHSEPPPRAETAREEIEATFQRLVDRGDVGLIIMNQPVADQIRATVAAHTLSVPMVLEIPAAGGGGAAAAAADPIMKRVLQMLGEGQ